MLVQVQVLERLRLALEELYWLYRELLPAKARHISIPGDFIAAATFCTVEFWSGVNVPGFAQATFDSQTDVSEVFERVQDHASGRGPDICESSSEFDFADEYAWYLVD